MAYVPHVLMQFAGRSGINDPAPESWSFSFRGVPVASISQTMADAVMGHAVAFFGNPDAHISDAFALQTVKLSNIGADGRVSGTVYTATTEDAYGDSAVGPLPFQCALAVSLRTGLRGPSRRGRFYLPGPASVVRKEDGELPVAFRDAVSGAVSTFLTALRDDADILWTMQINSSKGIVTLVNGFQIGRVVDTIRRRRRSLKEQYDTLHPL
jgi:hypothetical protein